MFRNYLNYVGSKDRYLLTIIDEVKQLSSTIGKDNSTFVDLFCGSAIVTINALQYFRNFIVNDACKPLMDLHYWIWNNNIHVILKNVREIINRYELSKDNKEGFLRLRHDYNEGILRNAPALYCLITHAFNYSLHLNKNLDFNAPSGAGRSYFNNSLENKLVLAHEEITKYMEADNVNVQFSSVDFEKVTGATGKCVYFVDPPYSATISKQPYRVGGLSWTEEHDRRLFSLLDSINEKGDFFMFTNCLVNNGVHNRPLSEWSQKYTVVPVRVDYTNCSYQRKNAGDTQEVIIKNF